MSNTPQPRRMASGVAVATCTLLILASCSSNPATSTQSAPESPNSAQSGSTGKVVNLVFQEFDPPDQAKGLQAAVDNWNQKHPGIHVKMRIVPFKDALSTYVREVGTGAGADILHTAFTWSADLGKNHQILSLDNYIKNDPPPNGIDDFVGLKITHYGNSRYSIPFTADSFSLVYNPALFKDAGIKQPPTSWDDLLADAKALTDTSGGKSQYGLCFAASSAPSSELWHIANVYLWSNGSTLVDEKKGTWQPGSSDTNLSQAMSYLSEFFKNGYSPKNMLSVDLGGDPTITTGLANGTCAMAMQEPTEFSVALKSNSDLMSAPLPGGTAGRVEQMGGRALSINPNSKNPDAAWKFILYLTSGDTFKNFYTNQFPAQKSLLKNKEYGPELAKENYDGIAKSIAMAQTYYQYSSSPAPVSAVWAATTQYFGSALSGQTKPDAAAAALNSKLTSLLKKGS